MISQIEDYFVKGCGRCDRFSTPNCATQIWRDGIAALRALCLSAGLTETVKWGQPCYTHSGRNIAIIGAQRDGFRLGFFNASLLSNRAGLLVKAGPNTRAPDTARLASAAEVDRHAADLLACIAEAMEHATRGTREATDDRELVLPEELEEALEADPDLAAAFAKLTPGRQRGYAIMIGNAKQPATRHRRVVGYRDRILAGKGPQDR